MSCHDLDSQSHDTKIAAVKLVHNSEVLLDWYAINIQKGITFAKLLEDVTHASVSRGPEGRFKREFKPTSKTYTACYVQKSGPQSEGEVEVSWGLPIPLRYCFLFVLPQRHVILYCYTICTNKMLIDCIFLSFYYIF